jgi:hypothetical protein
MTENLDHAAYLGNVLETAASGVSSDARYSPEKRAHALALMERFHSEIAVALRLPRPVDRRRLRLVVDTT